MIEIEVDFERYFDQLGNFNIDGNTYDYWLRWNYLSKQWAIDIRSPDPDRFLLGMTLPPNEFLCRNTGVLLFGASGGDLMLISNTLWSDMTDKPWGTQNNFRLVYLEPDEVLQIRSVKYGEAEGLLNAAVE